MTALHRADARSDWREHALVPVLMFLGMVVAVVSSLGAPLIPTIASRLRGHRRRRAVVADHRPAGRGGDRADPGRLGDGPHRRR